MQSTVEDDERYDNIIKRSAELKRQAESIKLNKQNKSDDNYKLPLKTYLTGNITGKIIDFTDISKNIITLKIRLENGEIINQKVNDTKKYEEDNELVRLLYCKNIKDYKIDELLGEEISLSSNKSIHYRNQSANKINWSINIPDKLDYHGQLKHKILSVYKWVSGDQYLNKITLSNIQVSSHLIILLFITMLLYLYFLLHLALTNFITTINFIILISIITFYASFILRFFATIFIKFKQYKKSDSLKNNL